MNRFMVVVVVAGWLVGCGGHTAKYRVDEVVLAPLPVEDKQAIFDAQNDIAVARAEKDKANAEADATKRELGQARSDRDRAELEVKRAKIEVQIADADKNSAKQVGAAEQRRVADLGKKTAEARIDALDARLSWQRALADQADAHIDAAMARTELEKAKLAAARNIRPTKDFDPAKFAQEYDLRSRRLDEARVNADKKRDKHEKAAARFDTLKAEYDARPPRS